MEPAWKVGELLRLLASEDPSVRNGAALELRGLAESGSIAPVEPSFAAIADSANRDNRGTLVYALQMMDCSAYFAELLELALYGNFERQNHALTILEEQSMEVTPEQILEAVEKVRAFIPPARRTGEAANLLQADLSAILGRLGDGDSVGLLDPV